MKLLTDKEICEWMGWVGNNQRWDTPDKQLILHTPDFSREQAWFDYVMPALYLKGLALEIKAHPETGGTATILNYETSKFVTATKPKLPDALRIAVSKLVEGE